MISPLGQRSVHTVSLDMGDKTIDPGPRAVMDLDMKSNTNGTYTHDWFTHNRQAGSQDTRGFHTHIPHHPQAHGWRCTIPNGPPELRQAPSATVFWPPHHSDPLTSTYVADERKHTLDPTTLPSSHLVESVDLTSELEDDREDSEMTHSDHTFSHWIRSLMTCLFLHWRTWSPMGT